MMKIREGLARDDYKDPGPYKNPQGTVAYEIETPASEPARQDGQKNSAKPSKVMKGTKPMQMKGMKMAM